MESSRRVEVVYYLSRGGHLDHPHLLELSVASSSPLCLRVVKKWLGSIRGKGMPAAFSWSYKRAYRNGYVWQDLLHDDAPIFPANGCEYVLMGSQILLKNANNREGGVNVATQTEFQIPARIAKLGTPSDSSPLPNSAIWDQNEVSLAKAVPKKSSSCSSSCSTSSSLTSSKKNLNMRSGNSSSAHYKLHFVPCGGLTAVDVQEEAILMKKKSGKKLNLQANMKSPSPNQILTERPHQQDVISMGSSISSASTASQRSSGNNNKVSSRCQYKPKGESRSPQVGCGDLAACSCQHSLKGGSSSHSSSHNSSYYESIDLLLEEFLKRSRAGKMTRRMEQQGEGEGGEEWTSHRRKVTIQEVIEMPHLHETQL